MIRGPLFKGSRFDGIEYCAHCGAYMTVRYVVTTAKGKFKVCSFRCEKAFKEKHDSPTTRIYQTADR
jgi:hypothetical protein